MSTVEPAAEDQSHDRRDHRKWNQGAVHVDLWLHRTARTNASAAHGLVEEGILLAGRDSRRNQRAQPEMAACVIDALLRVLGGAMTQTAGDRQTPKYRTYHRILDPQTCQNLAQLSHWSPELDTWCQSC